MIFPHTMNNNTPINEPNELINANGTKVIAIVTKIYKRSLLEENGLVFPEGIFYEDNCAAPLWSMYFNHFE